MTSSHNDFDKFSSALARRWIERELDASREELLQLNLLMNPQDSNYAAYHAITVATFYYLSRLTEKYIQISQGTYSVDYERELEEVEHQLKEIYQVENIDEYESELVNQVFPRSKFLLEKRQYLIAMKNSSEMILPESSADEEDESKERKGFLKVIFNIGKKFVDLIDDVWAAMRSVIPHNLVELIGPILVGATGFLIHLGEGYEGAKLAYAAYSNEKIGQRKTRILTSVLTFAIAGAGVGMSLALLASAAGATVAAAPLLPVLIPAALTAIYGLSLWRQSYIFHRAKEEEEKSLTAYQKALVEIEPRLKELTGNMEQLKIRKAELIAEIKIIERKLATTSDDKESNHLLTQLDQLVSAQKVLAVEQIIIDQQCAFVQGSIVSLKRSYDECREKRLEAERGVAFTTLEVAGSTMVLIGIILGTAAIVGAGLGTFGIAPLALIIAGVVTGAGSKIFEHQDEIHHHAYTKGIRKFFTDIFENVFSSKKTLDVQSAPMPVAALSAPAKKDEPPKVRSPSALPGPAPKEVKLRPASAAKISVAGLGIASQVRASGESASLSASSNEIKDPARRQKGGG